MKQKSAFRQQLLRLRQNLHHLAEGSGQEQNTAKHVSQFLLQFSPDEIVTSIGGHGLAAIYQGPQPGKTILFRAELDALPIDETLQMAYASGQSGVSHKCGHDGHMAIVCSLAEHLAVQPLRRGRVVLLFQPAEETGEGAQRVLSDPRFARLQPDFVYALHNLPGYPLGSVLIRSGVFAAASRGLVVEFEGSTAHAGQPERGNSPVLAMVQLIQALLAAPQNQTGLHEPALVTVIHAMLGEVAFGTSPGKAVVMATLRANQTEVIERLSAYCAGLAKRIGKTYNLRTQVRWTEEFPVTNNHPAVVNIVEHVAQSLALDIHYPEHAFEWSEDFGHFTAAIPGVLFGLGAGQKHPALHRPEYDFPDELLEIGRSLLIKIIQYHHADDRDS